MPTQDITKEFQVAIPINHDTKVASVDVPKIPSGLFRLSKKAIEDIRAVFSKEFGEKTANDFSDEELNKLGLFFLTILSENLKMKLTN